MSQTFIDSLPRLSLQRLSPGLAEQLSSAAKAYSLAYELGNAAEQPFHSAAAAARLRNQAETARQVGNYWRQRRQIESAAAAVREDLAVAVELIVKHRAALITAQDARQAASGRLQALSAQASLLRAEVSEAMSLQDSLVAEAQAAFDEAMDGDDDIEQEVAAGKLADAQQARALALDSLVGLSLRLHAQEELEAVASGALQDADHSLALAQRGLHEATRLSALIEMDRVTTDLVFALLRTVFADRACPWAHLPMGFSAITLWYSAKRRSIAAGDRSASGESSVLLQELHLGQLLRDLEVPDLSIFAEPAGEAVPGEDVLTIELEINP